MQDLTATDVIATKRDGGALTDAQIDWAIDAYTNGIVAEEQMAALLMAIYLNGMSPREIAQWTRAMINSGKRVDLSRLPRPTVDKHSTGGVGDKISLILVPLVAACGAIVPQMAGRGLGHTGGTLDKMESIPGWRADLAVDQFVRQLDGVGGAICAASEDLAPADRALYALRDATATVASIPMISASIMSKKIAAGPRNLVLDVKVGTGAFMTEVGAATELAHTMIDLGAAHGVRVSALLTDMSTPLGHAVGNAVEVSEALDVLAGGGPTDIVSLTLALADEMLRLARVDADPAAVLASGKAMDTWRAMVLAQGGDPDAELPAPRHVERVTAATDGRVDMLDAMQVARAAWRLGSGRARKEDAVQAAAGIICLAKPGDPVTRGAPLFELRTDTPDRLDAAMRDLATAVSIAPADEPSHAGRELVLATIRHDEPTR
ncbi:thymidine phosphorylase [Dactylosporangium sp. NPDC000244]|uniref:thymidine phosphorylase n=1 Tax=Dactylosporangium sp. NPDC000244 TaxID=3154365 RepID=UPI003327F0F5